MTRKQRRMTMIAFGGGVLVVALVMVLTALQGNVTFFFSPSEIAALKEPPARAIRVGGLVQDGSVERGGEREVRFVLTDGGAEVKVHYAGLLPDLFREGQGIIAEGRLLPSGEFEAAQILAKHDENYMPAEVADALKKQGHWKDEGAEY